MVFDQAPLLVFFLVGLALCTYIAIRNRFGDEDETSVENLDQSQKSESASGNANYRWNVLSFLSGALAFLPCILFRGSSYKLIETVETLILLLNKAAFVHCLGWSRSLFRCRFYFRVIAVEALLGLIVNLKAGL